MLWAKNVACKLDAKVDRAAGLGFAGKGRAAQRLERCDVLGTVLEQLRGDRALGLSLAGRSFMSLQRCSTPPSVDVNS